MNQAPTEESILMLMNQAPTEQINRDRINGQINETYPK